MFVCVLENKCHKIDLLTVKVALQDVLLSIHGWWVFLRKFLGKVIQVKSIKVNIPNKSIDKNGNYLYVSFTLEPIKLTFNDLFCVFYVCI